MGNGSPQVRGTGSALPITSGQYSNRTNLPTATAVWTSCPGPTYAKAALKVVCFRTNQPSARSDSWFLYDLSPFGLIALACLMIPAASFADSSVDFSNNGGTLAGSSSGLNSVRIHIDRDPRERQPKDDRKFGHSDVFHRCPKHWFPDHGRNVCSGRHFHRDRQRNQWGSQRNFVLRIVLRSFELGR